MYWAKKSKVVTIAGILTLITSASVEISWLFNLPGLRKLFPHYIAMTFNTALCFILLGLALLLTQIGHTKFNALIFKTLSLAVVLLASLSLSQTIFNFNAGIDQLVVIDRVGIADNYIHPGRMGNVVAVCFIFLGLAFMGFCAKQRFIHTISQYLLHLVTAAASVTVLGYLFSLPVFFNLRYINSMAAHTAILFFFLSIISTLLHPSLGITNLFTGSLLGNKMAGRIYILIVVTVLVLSTFRLESQQLEIFSLAIGTTLLVVSFLLISLVITWNTANWLNRIDIKRREAEEEVRVMNEELETRVEERSAELYHVLEKYQETEAQLTAAFEFSAIGMALISLDGRWLKVNRCLCRMLGYSEEELLSMAFIDIIHPDDRDVPSETITTSSKNTSGAPHTEKRCVCKNGSIIWVSINFATIKDNKNVPLYTASQIEDITERKNADANLTTAYRQIQTHITSIKDMAWKQSHLIRSPLANLKGLAMILKDDPTDDETLNNVNIELERLDKIIIEMARDVSNHQL